MSQGHRLQAVVKLREREEERARLDLASAHRQTAAAEEVARLAELRARSENRRQGPALDWEIAERAQASSLREAREARQAAAAATRNLTTKLAEFVGVHVRTEALRRVVKSRVGEQLAERETRESKALDEIAILRHRHAR